MKTKFFSGAALLACVAMSVAATLPGSGQSQASVQGVMPAAAIKGDYVEARTASVFCGACHYNGELVTTGHDAIMAWNITSGTWNGISLSGVRAMAAVTCDDSLGNDQASRKCELLIDSSATAAQSDAFADLLRNKCGNQLGQIAAIRRGAVSFTHDADYKVNAAGFGSIAVAPMPDAACCSQPNLVWFSPMVPLEHRMVGMTQRAEYTAGTLGDVWQRSDENGAFYGALAF